MSKEVNKQVKLISLQADGFRKLKAIDITFAENGLTEIRGDNSQGKTSVLDAIMWLFKGKRTVNDDIINYDKDKMSATIKFGEYIVKRVKTRNGDSVSISNDEGHKITSSPQMFLNNFINELTFNPFPFLNKTEYQKLEFLMEFYKFNVEEIETKLSDTYDDRRFKFQQRRDAGKPDKVKKVIKKSTIDLIADKDKLQKFNELQKQSQINIDNATVYIEDYADDLINLNDDLDELNKKVAKCKNDIKEKKDDIKAGKALLLKLPKPKKDKSLDVINKKLENIDEHNEKAVEYDSYLEAVDKYEKLDKEYNDLDIYHNLLVEKKKQMFKNFDTGIDKLELSENGVYYDGVHSQNWSDSEGIQVACELNQVMHPDLKAICVDRGESFGKQRKDVLSKWATDNDIQIIFTMVDEVYTENENPNVYYIENGEIK